MLTLVSLYLQLLTFPECPTLLDFICYPNLPNILETGTKTLAFYLAKKLHKKSPTFTHVTKCTVYPQGGPLVGHI